MLVSGELESFLVKYCIIPVSVYLLERPQDSYLRKTPNTFSAIPQKIYPNEKQEKNLNVFGFAHLLTDLTKYKFIFQNQT